MQTRGHAIITQFVVNKPPITLPLRLLLGLFSSHSPTPLTVAPAAPERSVREDAPGSALPGPHAPRAVTRAENHSSALGGFGCPSATRWRGTAAHEGAAELPVVLGKTGGVARGQGSVVPALSVLTNYGCDAGQKAPLSLVTV